MLTAKEYLDMSSDNEKSCSPYQSMGYGTCNGVVV